MGSKVKGDQGGRYREKPQGALGTQKSFRDEDRRKNVFHQREKKCLKN